MEKDLRCPECNSSQTRYRVKTKNRICYQCGSIYEVVKEEEKDAS